MWARNILTSPGGSDVQPGSRMAPLHTVSPPWEKPLFRLTEPHWWERKAACCITELDFQRQNLNWYASLPTPVVPLISTQVFFNLWWKHKLPAVPFSYCSNWPSIYPYFSWSCPPNSDIWSVSNLLFWMEFSLLPALALVETWLAPLQPSWVETFSFLSLTCSVLFRLSILSRCPPLHFYFNSYYFLLQNIRMFEVGLTSYISHQPFEFYSFTCPPPRRSLHALKALAQGSLLCVFHAYSSHCFWGPQQLCRWLMQCPGLLVPEFLTSHNFYSLPLQVVL